MLEHKLNLSAEKELLENMPWRRGEFYTNYGEILGYYQALSVMENIDKRSKVLDLACCDGVLTSYFSQYFSKVVGVDAAAQCLLKARELNPNVVFHESFIETLELKETFDGVFMLNLLEHVIDPVVILQKAASFLNKKGCLIVHVPNAEAMNRKIALEMGTLKSLDELSHFDIKIAGHRRCYTLDTLLADVEKANLSVIKTGGIFYKMLSMVQMDWFLDNAPWDKGGFGWGRVDNEGKTMNLNKDLKKEFCRACYEVGKQNPRDCNIIYAIVGRK